MLLNVMGRFLINVEVDLEGDFLGHFRDNVPEFAYRGRKTDKKETAREGGNPTRFETDSPKRTCTASPLKHTHIHKKKSPMVKISITGNLKVDEILTLQRNLVLYLQ
jgi:hypothetical protein